MAPNVRIGKILVVVVALTIVSAGCARQPSAVSCSLCPRPVTLTKPATIEKQGSFVSVGEMITPRSGHIATLLDDGRVLIVGGWSATGQLQSAEVYDPARRDFEPTCKMSSAHQTLGAATLSDGRVLFVGGSSAEIYNPRTGRFEPAGTPVNRLDSPTAVVLADERVLICAADRSCELYFPRTGTFRETSHTHGQSPHNPILLFNGTVLISVAGASYYMADLCYELFDPETETFRVLRSPHCGVSPAIELPDEKILLGSLFFDPRDEAFSEAKGFLNTSGSATLLRNGKVLAAGGTECHSLSYPGTAFSGPGFYTAAIQCSPTAKAGLYDPRVQAEVEIENMNAPRRGHTATRLKDGSVLLAGGTTNVVSSAEIYVP
jgi:hypothetical protein